MYSCSTYSGVQERAFDSGTGYIYLPHVAESMKPEHKASKRSQPEITDKYLNLINHHVDTIFVPSDLGTGQGLTTEEIKIFA